MSSTSEFMLNQIKIKRKSSHNDIFPNKGLNFENIDSIPIRTSSNMEQIQEIQEINEINSLLDNILDSTNNDSRIDTNDEIFDILRIKRQFPKYSASSSSITKKPQTISMSGRVLQSDKNLIQRMNSLPINLNSKTIPSRVSNPFIRNFDDTAASSQLDERRVL
jgi:hypothetical protein